MPTPSESRMWRSLTGLPSNRTASGSTPRVSKPALSYKCLAGRQTIGGGLLGFGFVALALLAVRRDFSGRHLVLRDIRARCSVRTPYLEPP